jgi:anaerobic selenocysteine-containing dehydrogenase
MCGEDCGIKVVLEEGRIIDVSGVAENPNNEGEICVKARAIPEYLYSESRLKHPLMREGNGWKVVSWDEAINAIVKKLKELKERHEERSVAIFQGYGVGHYEIKWFMQRFADLYGTPNFASVASLCFVARPIGHIYTYGALTVPRFEESNCIIIWGANPYTSSYPRWGRRIIEAKRRGAKLIVIDPTPQYFSDKADLLLQPLPGTDLALALGFMNVIIKEELYDRDFVEKWTIGFEKLKEHVESYPPEVVEKLTTVPKEKIVEAARLYATHKPACIHQGCGLEHHLNAVQTCRALAMLHAITGNIDVPGGNIFGTKLPTTFLRFLDRVKEQPLGGSKYPAWYELERSAHLREVINAMAEGEPYPIKVLIVAGANPLLTWPDTDKVRRALERLELFVVIDPFMTESAKLAHIVLPAATFLERYEHSGHLGQYGFPYLALRRPVSQPLGESKPDVLIWVEIAKGLGMNEYFPWKDMKEAIQAIIAPSGIKLEDLERNPAGISFATKKFKSYEGSGFRTPSGKVELYSERLKALNQDPIPVYREEAPLTEQYPLILVTGLRCQEYVHSQHRNIPKLRMLQPEPLLYINPETAKRYGVSEGEEILLETKKGTLKVKTKFDKYMHPKVVGMSHGWSDANVNFLTDWSKADPLSGFPNLKREPCNIRRDLPQGSDLAT